MSRIGRKPVTVPSGVEIDIKPGWIKVKGPKGELTQEISTAMTVELEDGTLTVDRPTNRPDHRALHGLIRSLVANMIVGVTDGYQKNLLIEGVGYRAAAKGRDIELAVGFSHPVSIEAPEGIEFELPQPTEIIVRGIDKQQVGQIAANIRKNRPPEPYKGKGIRYSDERIVRKAGKRV